MPTPPRAVAADDADAEPSPVRIFRGNLSRALAEAEAAGWTEAKRIPIPGHHAALVVYDPLPENAPAYLSHRVDAVSTADQIFSKKSGMIDLARPTKGSLLWDLTGTGARFVVVQLTPCGANCGLPEPWVLELGDDDAFSEPASLPVCPTCRHDDNADGVPEFEVPLVTLSIAPCSRVSCGPTYALNVDVLGYETWNGERFTKGAAELLPIYRDELARARREVGKLPAGGCPLEALKVAGEIVVYARLVGENPSGALGEAERIMSGRSTQPCATAHDLLDQPKSWAELRHTLEHAKLPKLSE